MSSKSVNRILVNVIPAILIVGLLAWRIAAKKTNVAAERQAKQEMKEAKAQALSTVGDGAEQDQTFGATVIDLKPFVTAALTDSPISPRGTTSDNLAELRKGVNIYAGIPFDVEGSIHLMGGQLRKYGKRYPEKVEKIPIGRICTKIHCFHGASDVTGNEFGQPVARLIIHYTDGTTNGIDFVAGEQVFDWWRFPWDNSRPVPPDVKIPAGFESAAKVAAPGTKLAWIGTNPWIKRWSPGMALCLFRTTFPNPQPAKEIASVDYCSMMTQTVPFLVGLTVE